MARSYPYVLLLLILSVIGLFYLNWYGDRPLFLDEANVVRNLFDRSYTELFQPLDHEQYAPPMFLVWAKLCAEGFGYLEQGIRYALFSSVLLILLGLLLSAKALKLEVWTLLPIAALAMNDLALRYFIEIKPYGFDLGVAAFLLAVFLKRNKPDVLVALVGALAPWVSLPSIFVLASGGLWTFFRRNQTTKTRLQWLSTAVFWLSSFGLLYYLTLRHSLSESSLTDYHQAYFFPVTSATGGIDLNATFELLYQLIKAPFGHTVLSISSGMTLALYGWFTATERKGWLLAGPLLLAVIFSAGAYYSLIPRLLLFTFPGWWLGAALGARRLYHKGGKMQWLAIGLAVASISGVDWPNHFRPVAYSDSRQLVTTYDSNYLPVLDGLSFPGFDYYHRVHPFGDGLPDHALVTDDYTGNLRYVRLYDVLTSEASQQSLRQEEMRATARGCKVRLVEQFRAAALYVDCSSEMKPF